MERCKTNCGAMICGNGCVMPNAPDAPPQGKRGGLEPIPGYRKNLPCSDPLHTPPMYISIPAGMQYRHICPSCGRECVMRQPEVRLHG